MVLYCFKAELVSKATVARRSYTVGSPRATIVDDPARAAELVARGAPVLLVAEDADLLGAAVAGGPDRRRRERLLAVMVGDPDDPVVMAAAQEMAAELWPWSARDGDGDGDGDGP
jgi:hypothetical protein